MTLYDALAGDGALALRVFVDRSEGVASVRSLLDRMRDKAARRARGAVSLCLLSPDLPGEVDVLLGEDFPVTPQVRSALNSLDGVVTVEEA